VELAVSPTSNATSVRLLQIFWTVCFVISCSLSRNSGLEIGAGGGCALLKNASWVQNSVGQTQPTTMPAQPVFRSSFTFHIYLCLVCWTSGV
jgi:hypothetical protein